MKPSRVAFVLLGAAFALLLTACGGGQNVPAGAVAVVNGTEISRSDLDTWVSQAKKSYQAQKQVFPKVGTSEYQSIQGEYVAFLVQNAEFEQAAQDLGVTITEKDIDKGVEDWIKAKNGGSREKFEKALKDQDFSKSLFRQIIRVQVLGHKLYDAVTKNVKVPEKDVLAYYQQNLQAPSREVRHILISKKKADGQVDYPKSKALADQIYRQLQSGAGFAALAKKYSADTSSAAVGGKYTAVQGHDVPEFDAAAFSLKTGEISKPVKTTYGYHVIQALKDEVKTPLSKVEAGIRASLLLQQKQQVSAQWAQDLAKKYKSKISYATGFAPPELPSTSSTTTATQ
jgi:foldase protein PrsA